MIPPVRITHENCRRAVGEYLVKIEHIFRVRGLVLSQSLAATDEKRRMNAGLFRGLATGQ